MASSNTRERPFVTFYSSKSSLITNVYKLRHFNILYSLFHVFHGIVSRYNLSYHKAVWVEIQRSISKEIKNFIIRMNSKLT